MNDIYNEYLQLNASLDWSAKSLAVSCYSNVYHQTYLCEAAFTEIVTRVQSICNPRMHSGQQHSQHPECTIQQLCATPVRWCLPVHLSTTV